MRKRAKVLTPREARTHKHICELPRDNVATAGYWVLLGGDGDDRNISFAKQRSGEPSEWIVSIPRRDLERFIDWYNTGRWGRLSPSKKAKRGTR